MQALKRPNGQEGFSRAKVTGLLMGLGGLVNLVRGLVAGDGVDPTDFNTVLTGAGIVFLRDGMK